MNKQILLDFIKQNKSSRQIAEELQVSQTTIRYWLKKYNLKTKIYTQIIDNKKVCTKCNINKEISEYYFKNKKHKNMHSECKLCFNSRITEQFRDLKTQCIEYKGSKCQICDYNKYQGALEFHHLDPNEKDFAISAATSRLLNETMKKELDKCILVCSNCHKEIHAKLVDI
jgi:DNA-binding transcriptional MerR regulator